MPEPTQPLPRHLDLTRECVTAANWWAEQLPKPKATLAEQAGARPGDALVDPRGQGLFDRVAAKEADDVTPERVETFKAALVDVLKRETTESLGHWAESALSHFNVVVATDYGPDHLLGEALEAAGLGGRSLTLLPMKTCMWVKIGRVDVAAGYGAAIEEVPLVEGSVDA